MGSKQSKYREEPQDLTREPWRKYQLDLEVKEWDATTVNELISGIEEIAQTKDQTKPKLKIFVIGHIGSGKSSLINSFLAAFTGVISNLAVEGGINHTTYGVYRFPAQYNDGRVLNFEFFDTTGLGLGPIGQQTLRHLMSILGDKKIKNLTKSNRGNQLNRTFGNDERTDEMCVDEKAASVLLYVIDGWAYQEKLNEGGEDKSLFQLLELKETLDKYNIPSYLIVTHMDKIEPELSESIKLMHKSPKIFKVLYGIENRTKFPLRTILPVTNAVESTHEMEDPYRVYFLYILWAIVKNAKQFQAKMLEQKEKQEESQSNQC